MLFSRQIDREYAIDLLINQNWGEMNEYQLQNKEINTHLQVVLYLDSARAEIVFRVVELLYAIQVSIAGQMNRLVGW